MSSDAHTAPGAETAMWRGVYQHQLAKFKEKFPPEACIGRALEILGIGQEPRRMAS